MKCQASPRLEPVGRKYSVDLTTSVAFWSAIATACSAVFVGWQALETRRTAQSSRRAAEDGRDAVRVANATLELAREQSQQSAILVKDSIRARLDIKAPAISMTLRQGTSMAADHFMVEKPGGLTYLRPIEPHDGVPFELPEDNDTWIYAVYWVAFHNDGLVPVTIRSASMGRSLSGTFVWMETLRVPVGESVYAMLAIGTSVEKWVMALEKNTEQVASGCWETVLHEDTGVRLSQTFHVEEPMIEAWAGGKGGESYCIPRNKSESKGRASIVVGDQERGYVIAGKVVESLAPSVEETNMLALKGPKPMLTS